MADAFHAEWGRVVATLVRLTGDWDLAEECAQDAFATALERWSGDGVPRRPGAWLTTVARNRALDRLRRDRVGASKEREVAVLQADPAGDESAAGRRRRDRRGPRRSPPPHLHLLPSCVGLRGTCRADPAHAGRHDDGRDRPRLPRSRTDHGPTARPGQAQDPQRRHPLRRPARPPAARAHQRRCWPSSTCSSTRGTRPARAATWCGGRSATRPSAWAAPSAR